jgi:hypothetical protein
MKGHGSRIRPLAALGAVAVMALGISAPGFAQARSSDLPVTHPIVKRAAAVRLVSLGYGPCDELEVFLPITNGHAGIPMC